MVDEIKTMINEEQRTIDSAIQDAENALASRMGNMIERLSFLETRLCGPRIEKQEEETPDKPEPVGSMHRLHCAITALHRGFDNCESLISSIENHV